MKKKTFMDFSADVRETFESEESFATFSQLLLDATNNNLGTYELEDGSVKEMTMAEATEVIREKFRQVMGINKNATPKQIRNALRKYEPEVFEVLEETIENMLTTGWANNRFYEEFVEIRNKALGDTDEFVTEDETILAVNKVAGNHHRLERQRLGHGETYRVTTYWIGIAIYHEFELMMAGRVDWARLTAKLYEAVDNYINETMFESVMTASSTLLTGNRAGLVQTGTLNTDNKGTFDDLIDAVAMLNNGSEVIIMGTKAALKKITGLAEVDWVTDAQKAERATMGRLGSYEGTRMVEIPQVFAKGTTDFSSMTKINAAKKVSANTLLVVAAADNKFVKFVYEGDSQISQVTDKDGHQDQTIEYEYQTKIGVATVFNRAFGKWTIS